MISFFSRSPDVGEIIADVIEEFSDAVNVFLYSLK